MDLRSLIERLRDTQHQLACVFDYWPTQSPWLTAAQFDGCEKHQKAEQFSLVFLFLSQKIGHQVEQRACANKWLNGSVDQSNLIWRLL